MVAKALPKEIHNLNYLTILSRKYQPIQARVNKNNNNSNNYQYHPYHNKM